jgi:hypothetical protein
MANEIKTLEINDELLGLIRGAARAAVTYQAATGGERRLGITGEVGEVLACHVLGLRLAVDPRCKGFDAVDANGKLVQIKTRRRETPGLPKDVGRIGTFSDHKFDYALLVILNYEYELHEIWRADYRTLAPVIAKERKRNPHLATFKKLGRKVFPT